MKKIKNIIFPLCLATVGCVALGAVSLAPLQANAAMSVAEALDSFVMEDGAAVRKGTEKQGIRFNAILGEEAYEVLSNKNAQFGMLIVPKDYVTTGYELTVENVFGENAVYQANVKASEVEEGKKAIIQITEPTIEKKGTEYKIYGSLVGVLTNNIARGFIGTAYAYVDGNYYLADYAGDLVANNTRSMAYVAKLAVDDGDGASSGLQTNYIDPVKDKSFDYTVNKVTVDFDGTMTKEVLASSTAQFATPIVYNTDTMFGFDGQGVDGFVGMENAEFNVVYSATPLTVVVEADASATELYVAEELAGYITQVTGKTVAVSNAPAFDYNNIYVATDTSLGLEADSFKLSTDSNGNVHINGVDERGTLYGVYEYEEAYMGVKFLSESYTHVPVTNRQVATVSETKTYTPSFAYRTYMNNGIGLADDANVKYSSHLRFISQFSNDKAQTDLMDKVQYDMPWMASGWLPAAHSMLSYAAVGAWQSGAGDIVDYSLGADGRLTSCAFKSSATSSSYKSAFDKSGSVLDVCYSNATAKAWVKAGLKYAIENYPEMEYFMLGQADKRTTCSCTSCLRARLSGCNKSYMIASFVKEVASYINSLGYTDKKIVMFAYQDTETNPPKVGNGYAALTDMPSNVYVQWAPVDSDRYYALDSTNIQKWKTALGMTEDRFLVWSYETDFASYFTYYPTMQNWVANFDTYKDLGVDVVMMQSTWNTSGVANSYLDAYVASKLLWSFEADNQAEMNALVEAAKSEFIEYFYGANAKAYVEAYYTQFDALYAKKFASRGYQDGTWSFTETELNGLLSLLEQAMASTDNETYKNHLNMLALTPRYMLVKYCQKVDATLANDISSVATKTSETTSVNNDVNLQGSLSFMKGYATIYNVEYDDNGRIVAMTVDIPDVTEWYQQSPRFTAEYMNSLYAQGVQYVSVEVSSTESGAHFITMYNGAANYYADNGDQRAVAQDGGEFLFSYVDVDGGQGLTKATTLQLKISYLTDSQITAKEIGLTVENNVSVVKNADTNAYTLSNTDGMFTAQFTAEQVNKWIAAGYDAISMNVSFTPSATISKTVCMNGENFDTMKSLLMDESGNVAWTLILAEDTPISVWAQKGDSVSSDAFTLSNVTLLSHEMSGFAYDESAHWNACTREGCNHIANLQAHSYQQFDMAIGASVYGCATCGYMSSKTPIENPTVDFTANMYGATVYSHEWAMYDASRVAATADTLRYLAYHDNGNVNALSTLYLPKMDFASLNTVSITVLFETFAWNQQYGLDANALTNVSDTWIDWASHTGTLTFEMVDGALQMTLQMNGKTLTKMITDEAIINGQASATLYVQAYYDRYVTLSDFTFGGAVAIPDDGRFASGYATVTDVQYNENEQITSLTMDIPHNVEWSNNSPVLTQDYLNALYAAGIRRISFNVASTTTTNNFIVLYGDVVDYNAVAATFDIKKDGGDLKLSYVNLNNGGMTVETTLTINLSYQIDPQLIANEIGLTLASGVNMTKDAEGVYTLSNLNGYQGGAYFTAEQVNAWIAAGWKKLSLRATFTPSGDIDQIVGYTASLGYFTNESGSVDWTITLKANEAIDFWVQKSGRVSSGAFTMSNVTLQRYDAQLTAGYATVSNMQYDANGRLVGFTASIPDNTEWSGNAPYFTAEYLNALYAEGVRKLSLNVVSTNSSCNFITYYNEALDYDPRDGYDVTLLANAGALKISYVNLNNGYTAATTVTIAISYEFDPQVIAGEIGLTLANGVQIEKTAEGYTLSNMSGYQGGAYITAEQVNVWRAQGYTSITVKVTFTKGDNIDTVVGYTPATGFLTNGDGAFEWTIPLTADQPIDFWVQKDGAVSSGAFTITQITLQ